MSARRTGPERPDPATGTGRTAGRAALAAVGALFAAAVLVAALGGRAGSRAPERARAAAGPLLPLGPTAPARVAGYPVPQGTHAADIGAVQLGTPPPRRDAPLTARRAVAEWLDAWHDRAWRRAMLWSSAVPAPQPTAAQLRARFWPSRLAGWVIRRVRRDGDRARANVLVAVAPALRAKAQRRVMSVPLRRAAGHWSVVVRRVAAPLAGAMAPVA